MRILIVDDSKLHRKIVQKIISFVFPSAEIICCYDAFDAWAALKGLPSVDMMVLDHNMPYAKGGEFIGKIRSCPVFTELPIIMLTGDTGGEAFLKLGANAYFCKPFDPNEFKKIIADLGLSRHTVE